MSTVPSPPPGGAESATPSLWLHPDFAEPHVPSPPLRGELRCDVAVVGGGLAGLLLSRELIARGARVALVEARELAAGASGRNAGFLLLGLAEPYSRVCQELGRERARLALELSGQNHARIRAILDETGIQAGYARHGSLIIARSTAERDDLWASRALLGEDGFDVEWRDPDQLGPAYQAAPPGTFLGGLFVPADGEIDPVRFVRGLGRDLVRRGLRLHERSPVRAVVDGPETGGNQGPATVVTDEGRIHAGRVVIALNAYADALHPFFRGRVRAVRGQVLATAPILDQRGEVERLFEAPVYANYGYEYWRQTACGRVVIGGWRTVDLAGEVGTVEAVNPRVQQAMTGFLHSAFPRLAEVAIEHRWAGIMGFSSDGLPLVGPIPGARRLFTLAGFTGHGLGFSAIAAAHLGNLLAGEPVDGSPAGALFDPARLVQDGQA